MEQEPKQERVFSDRELERLENGAMNTGRRFFIKPIFDAIRELRREGEGAQTIDQINFVINAFIKEAEDLKKDLETVGRGTF
jgi:hypothetical protein